MKGKLLMRVFAVPLEYCKPEHLFGSHPIPAGIGTGCCCEPLEDKFHEAGVGVERLGYLRKLLHNGVPSMGLKRLI